MNLSPQRCCFLATLTLLMLLLPLTPTLALQAHYASAATEAILTGPGSLAPARFKATPATHLEQQASIRINEVMPNPGGGEFEWVELYNPSSLHRVHLPLVLRTYNP